MDRTERQKLGIRRWLDAGGKGTLSWCTGAGKTRATMMAIQLLLKKKPDAQILISVPTEVLKEQWIEELIKFGIFSNCKVVIINTIVKREWEVDLLAIDEAHLTPTESLSRIFDCVNYNFILCLTATLQRLDGKEVLIKQYAPVVDEITIEEAKKNGWVSPYNEYVVLLDVDLTEYNKMNQTFLGYFSQLNFEFDTAMKCATDSIFRNKLAKKLGMKPKDLAGIAYGWMSALRGRKAFVQSHPKKFEIAKKILEARKDKKCITFSATIKDAEKIGVGYVLHSKQSKKLNKEILDKFNSEPTGVLNSSKAVDAGVDVKGLSVGIILSTDSSKIRKTQRIKPVAFFKTFFAF